MSKRDVPKLNIDNFAAGQSLMKLHLGSIGDYVQTSITVDHVEPAGPFTTKDLSKKKEHNQAMLEIASTLSYQPSMEEMRTSREPIEKASEESLMI